MIKLQEPDLEKMWRTWINIELDNQAPFKSFQDTIREKIHPILQLQKNGHIEWFYFLFHPKTDDKANLYFDIVFTTKENPSDYLPEYCLDTKKIDPISSISGIDEEILQNKDIKKAWKIIGDQSEFIINLVCSHRQDREIHPKQIAQFMHYFMNSLGYGLKSLFFPRAHLTEIQSLISQIERIPGGEWRLY